MERKSMNDLKENNIGFINSTSDDVIYFDTATLH